MTMYISVVFVALFAFSKATSIGIGISQPETPFAGSPTLCRLPNSTYCGVDYSVPDVIATLVNIIEEEIKGQVEDNLQPGEALSDCQLSLKEIYCAQRFPKCVDNTVLLTSSANCKQKLEGNCSNANDLLEANTCGLEDASISLGTCSTVDSFTSSSQTLEYCDSNVLEGDALVTEWMFKLIQFTDVQLSRTLAPGMFVPQTSPGCSPGYATYFCQFLGECTENSEHIKLNNDYHSCEETLNCYDDAISDGLRPFFPCDQWLNLEYPTVDPDRLTTTSKPAPPSTDSPPGPGDVVSINPEPRPLPGFNGAQTVHSHLMVFVTVALLSVLIVQSSC